MQKICAQIVVHRGPQSPQQSLTYLRYGPNIFISVETGYSWNSVSPIISKDLFYLEQFTRTNINDDYFL